MSWFRAVPLGIGLVAGLLNGLLSVGGTLLVPALAHLLGQSQRAAHGTALAVILPTSLISFAVYFAGHGVDLGLAARIAAGGAMGAWAGARLLPRLSGFWLRRLFAVAMTAAALQMVLGGRG